MKIRLLKSALHTTLLTLAGALIIGSAAIAQFEGPPSGSPPPPGAGMGDPGGPGGPGGPHPASLTDLPIATLTSELKLADGQQAKITQIQQQFQKDREANRPPPPDPSSESGPPDPSAMRANMDKMRAAHKQACADIQAVLTDSQKKSLKPLMKMLNDLQAAGVPAPVYSDLNLNDEQKQKLMTIAKSVHEKVNDAFDSGDMSRETMDQIHQAAVLQSQTVLTDSQKATVAQFEKTHPHPKFGGPPPPGLGGPPPSDGV